MSNTLTYRQMGTMARGQLHTLFAQTMGYVATTAALDSAPSYAGLASGAQTSAHHWGEPAVGILSVIPDKTSGRQQWAQPETARTHGRLQAAGP